MSRRQIGFFLWQPPGIYQLECGRARLFALNRDGFDAIGEPRAHFYRLALAYVAGEGFVAARFGLQVGAEAPGGGGRCRVRMKAWGWTPVRRVVKGQRSKRHVQSEHGSLTQSHANFG